MNAALSTILASFTSPFDRLRQRFRDCRYRRQLDSDNMLISANALRIRQLEGDLLVARREIQNLAGLLDRSTARVHCDTAHLIRLEQEAKEGGRWAELFNGAGVGGATNPYYQGGSRP